MQSTDQTAPSVAQCAEEVRAQVAASQALAASRQGLARVFITDHGHEVLAGHAPVTAGQEQRGRPA